MEIMEYTWNQIIVWINALANRFHTSFINNTKS